MTTFAELVQELREDYLDDTSDAPDQSDEGYLWSDAFLMRSLAGPTGAEYEACRRTDLIFDKTTAAVTQVTLVDGTATYSLHDKVTRIHRVIYDDTPLTHKAEHEMHEADAQWRTRTGTPTDYLVEGRSITLHPIPDSDDDGATLYLHVFRLPLTSFATEPEIPEEWHVHLCKYGAYRAYRRRDPDTQDIAMSDRFLAEFNAVFGPPVSSLVREHQLRSPSSLKMRFDFGYADNQRSVG